MCVPFWLLPPKKNLCGGINEFGYYEPDTDGSLAYHCMSDTLESSVRFLGNVWGIHETDNLLYFQGDGCVVKYLNGKYTAIEMNAKIDCSNMVNGILYIGTDRGVWLLVGNTFSLFRVPMRWLPSVFVALYLIRKVFWW